jgi:hypothetical protein
MIISAVVVFLPPFLAAALLGFAEVSAVLVAAMVRLFLTWAEGMLRVRASECEAGDDTGGVPGRDKAEREDMAGLAGASKAEEDNASGIPGASEAVEEDSIDGVPGEEETADIVGRAGATGLWIGSVRGAGIVNWAISKVSSISLVFGLSYHQLCRQILLVVRI